MRFSTKYKRKSKINQIFDLGLDIKPIRKLRVLKNRNSYKRKHNIPIRITGSSSNGIYSI